MTNPAWQAGLLLVGEVLVVWVLRTVIHLPDRQDGDRWAFWLSTPPRSAIAALCVVALAVLTISVLAAQRACRGMDSPRLVVLGVIVTSSAVAGVIGGAGYLTYLGHGNSDDGAPIFVLDWLYPLIPAALARLTTRSWPRSLSKAAAILAAAPVIVVRAFATVEGVGLNPGWAMTVYIDMFGLLLGGMLLGGMSKYRGYFSG